MLHSSFFFWFPVHGICSVQMDLNLNASNWADLSACIVCWCVCPCADVCEPAALLKVPEATLGSEGQVKEKSLHLCVRTLGRPGNPGASCWVEPMPKANSWRAPGCVCACLHAPPLQQGCRPGGFAYLGASNWGEQLRLPGVEPAAGWLVLGTRGIYCAHVCMCFPLTGSSWSARAGKRIRFFVLCLHVCSALCLRPVVYSVCVFIYVHTLYTWGFSGHECLLGIHAQACYWLYPEDMELNSLFSTRPADSAAPNIWRGPPFSEQGQPEQVAF